MEEKQFTNLLRILKLIGGKFIIVEDGRPRVVLMDYEEFQELAVPYYAGEIAERAARAEEVNQQITKAQLEDLREEVIVETIEPEIRVEPL